MVKLSLVRKPHHFLAVLAIINKMLVTQPYPAINSWLQVRIAVLAKPFLELRANPYLGFHGNLPCKLNIPVAKLRLGLESLLCLKEKSLNPVKSNLSLLHRLLPVLAKCHG